LLLILACLLLISYLRLALVSYDQGLLTYLTQPPQKVANLIWERRFAYKEGGTPMKIAISSTGPSVDSTVDPRFGRCQFFLIVELDNMSFEAVPNVTNTLEGGAGIQAAKLVVDRGKMRGESR
jgi:hypothetical protein